MAVAAQQFWEQGAKLQELQRGLAECREEMAAMRACLAGRNVVRQEQFWAQLHRLRFEAAQRRHGLGVCATAGEVLSVQGLVALVGAFVGPAALEAACLGSRAWTAAFSEELLAARHNLACRFVVCGGGDLEEPSKTVEQFNLASGTWEALPRMREARWGPAVGVLGSELYVCGGGDGDEALRSVEVINPHSSGAGWEYAEEMRTERFGAAAMVRSGVLYVCGGESSEEQVHGSVESYDPLLGVWTVEPSLFERRGSLAGGCLQGVLYVCGGCDESDRPMSSVERLDVSVGAWGFAPAMREARAGAAVAASRRRLWVCGGKGEIQERLNSAECFDPEVGVWEALAPMGCRRNGAAAAASGGRVFVFGGYNGETAQQSAEVWEELGRGGGESGEAGHWAPLPAMSMVRWATSVAVVTMP